MNIISNVAYWLFDRLPESNTSRDRLPESNTSRVDCRLINHLLVPIIWDLFIF